MLPSLRFAPLLLLAALVSLPAGAEIAVLVHGGMLKVDAVERRGEQVRLVLRGGGEVELPAGELRGVVPDEIVEEIAAAEAQPGPHDPRALATEVARRHGLDPALVLAVMGVESAFRPDAVSHKGAQGLMQLMPGTAKELGVADPLDPAQNVDGGARYLRDLLARYEGDVEMALAAYNAGPGAVARHGGIPPYRETRDYVRKVLERYKREAAGS
ncbi:MAG: lytic transglycosylase domain-containing protein [Vicinamibacteria bacterium]|nr:lytic transglycosylase domain-containing protein [Vicinamibacteria bacterium]